MDRDLEGAAAECGQAPDCQGFACHEAFSVLDADHLPMPASNQLDGFAKAIEGKLYILALGGRELGRRSPGSPEHVRSSAKALTSYSRFCSYTIAIPSTQERPHVSTLQG